MFGVRNWHAVEAWVEQRASTLRTEKLKFYVAHLAREADRFEFLLTGSDKTCSSPRRRERSRSDPGELRRSRSGFGPRGDSFREFRHTNPSLSEEPAEQATPPLTLRHSWDRASPNTSGRGRVPPGRFELFTGGSPLGAIAPVAASKWKSFPPELSESLADRLRSTSFVDVSVDGGPRATLLIREEGMAQKPSILMILSAEEILRYWSLLSVEQRQAFLADKAQDFMVREGILAPRIDPLRSVFSMFDRFAAVFHRGHAFSMLREHVVASIEAGREKEPVYRLFGEKYDSLPSLIRTVLGDREGDVVNRTITLLTAQDKTRCASSRRSMPRSFNSIAGNEKHFINNSTTSKR